MDGHRIGYQLNRVGQVAWGGLYESFVCAGEKPDLSLFPVFFPLVLFSAHRVCLVLKAYNNDENNNDDDDNIRETNSLLELLFNVVGKRFIRYLMCRHKTWAK